jgi:subtilisin inhibitor-like
MTPLATALAALTITVWPQGLDGDSQRWTLRCGPAGGSHPSRVAACSKLLATPSPFRPVPRNATCTTIYGGPDVAIVTGRFRGARVWAKFQLRNGCEISRWKRVVPLLPSLDA